MSKMVKSTLAEQAYHELRSRIVSGQLQGGTRLLPAELAQELGISPTPVKEACMRLEAAGLAISSARRGMVVRRFTQDDMEELYAARMLLEKGALEVAFAKGKVTDELLAALTESLNLHRINSRGITLDELAAALGYDRQFHRHLVAAAGIGMLSEWHDRIIGQTHTVFVSVPGNYEQSVAEHEEILAALIARDEVTALDALYRHLSRSRDNSLLQVRSYEQRFTAS
jgi:DNA-binding GntR family transcriptional regulator